MIASGIEEALIGLSSQLMVLGSCNFRRNFICAVDYADLMVCPERRVISDAAFGNAIQSNHQALQLILRPVTAASGRSATTRHQGSMGVAIYKLIDDAYVTYPRAETPNPSLVRGH
jgi:hypothetical protein